jgi:hypothetical protein
VCGHQTMPRVRHRACQIGRTVSQSFWRRARRQELPTITLAAGASVSWVVLAQGTEDMPQNRTDCNLSIYKGDDKPQPSGASSTGYLARTRHKIEQTLSYSCTQNRTEFILFIHNRGTTEPPPGGASSTGTSASTASSAAAASLAAAARRSSAGRAARKPGAAAATTSGGGSDRGCASLASLSARAPPSISADRSSSLSEAWRDSAGGTKI